MRDMLEYRGYAGSILYSEEDRTLHGRVMSVRDLVTYEGKDVKSLECAFRDAVDDYRRLRSQR